MRPEAMPIRAECPEPWRWSAPDDFATEAEVSAFLGDLVRVLKPATVIETGSYLGYTAQAIGRALALVGGTLVTLEVDGDRAAAAAGRCAGLPVTVLAQSSLTYTPTALIDVLFLDSEFETRMPELRHFRPYASPRCVVVLHDSAPTTYPGWELLDQGMRAVVADGIVQPWLTLPTPRGVGLTRYR